VTIKDLQQRKRWQRQIPTTIFRLHVKMVANHAADNGNQQWHYAFSIVAKVQLMQAQPSGENRQQSGDELVLPVLCLNFWRLKRHSTSGKSGKGNAGRKLHKNFKSLTPSLMRQRPTNT
jgi:hypothetical protein